jgi:hypothetical protein
VPPEVPRTLDPLLPVDPPELPKSPFDPLEPLIPPELLLESDPGFEPLPD